MEPALLEALERLEQRAEKMCRRAQHAGRPMQAGRVRFCERVHDARLMVDQLALLDRIYVHPNDKAEVRQARAALLLRIRERVNAAIDSIPRR